MREGGRKGGREEALGRCSKKGKVGDLEEEWFENIKPLGVGRRPRKRVGLFARLWLA